MPLLDDVALRNDSYSALRRHPAFHFLTWATLASLVMLAVPTALFYFSPTGDYGLLPLAAMAGSSCLLFGCMIAMYPLMAVVAVRSYAKSGSPFAKIWIDASAVFATGRQLYLLPGAILFSTVLSGSALYWAPAFARWFYARYPWSLESLPGQILAISIPCIAAALGPALCVGAANAVLTQFFIESNLGRRATLTSAALSTLARLPRVLGFTLMWFTLLGVVSCIHLGGDIALLRKRLLLPEIIFDFAFFAIETGLVMAAYLMLAVMLRENIGALESMRRTLLIVKKEYGRTLSELIRLNMLDEAVWGIICVLSFVGGGLGIWAGMRLDPTGNTLMLPLGVAGTMLTALFFGSCYFVVLQTLQMLLACAVYLYIQEGVLIEGFKPADFENVLGLDIRALPAGVTQGSRK